MGSADFTWPVSFINLEQITYKVCVWLTIVEKFKIHNHYRILGLCLTLETILHTPYEHVKEPLVLFFVGAA